MAVFPMVKTANELALEEKQKAEAERNIEGSKEEKKMSDLAAYIRKVWEKAKTAKSTIADLMIEDLRQRNGEYDPTKLAQIRQIRSSEPYDPLVNRKCRTMEAWIREILNQPGQRPFAVEATPVPELPKEIEDEITQKFYREALYQIILQGMQTGTPMDTATMLETVQDMLPTFQERLKKLIINKAKQAAEEMSQEIDDKFREGGWYGAIDKCIYDIVTLRSAILKGPVIRQEKIRKLTANPQTGTMEVIQETRTIPQYDRVSPFDFFPLWDSEGVDDGDTLERIYYRPDQLSDMIGLPGFQEDEIKAVLQEYEEQGLDDWQTDVDADRDEQEKQKKDETASTARTKIACLEWWGAVSGQKLSEFGLKDESGDEPKDLDPVKIYSAKAWLIKSHIIKAALNSEPNREKPYSIASLEEIPGSMWGRGVPAHLKHLSNMLCAFDRAVANNIGIASGPQVDVNKNRYPEGYDFTLWPWKVWISEGSDFTNEKPINFFSPTMQVEKIIRAYEHYMKIADDSSVPSYAHGDTQIGGAGSTLGGLSMLMRGGARMVQTAIRNIDRGLIERSATKQFYWNLENNPRKAIIGDLKVVAKGSSHLTVKEQEAIRMMEFARNTNNALDAQITGLEGRRYLLATAAKALNIDPEEAFPKPEMATPVNPLLLPGGMTPANNQPGARTLDQAGNPVQGKDFMMEKRENA